MQGIALMPQNPQQGSPPPNTSIVTDVSMDVSLQPNDKTKENSLNQSDSGIFSATNNSLSDQMDLSSRTNNTDNCESDNRSDCSSPQRNFFCPICKQMLTSQHEFTLHIKSHNNETDFQDNEKGCVCRICNKVLSSSSSLDRHVLVHSGERPFNCKYCGDTFTTNGNMHRHMRTHTHKSDNYESDGSSDSGSSKFEYNNNKIDEKTGNKRKCESTIDLSCKRREYSSDSDAPSIYRCPVCERSDFNSVPVLRTHIEDNHPDYPAKCDQCDQIFQNNKLLQSHRMAVHENNTPKHSVLGFKDLTFVDFTSEKFTHIARYECEKNLHKVTGSLRFQCKKCTRAFPSLNSLNIHEQDCISNSGLDLTKSTKISETDIRRNEFFSRLDLQDNSPEKVSSPPLAAEASPSPNHKLRQQLLGKAMHMDTTKDLADIQSIISMTTSGSLLQQLQSKTNEIVMNHAKIKPDILPDINKGDQEEESQDVFAIEFRKMKLRGEFPCRLCTAIFPNLRALKGHNRAHLNGNNNGTYRCNMCPHSSFDKAALIRHMRTHNGDRPYECSLCNYAFTTKANCERHLRNRHAKTTREEVKKALIYHPSEDPTNDDVNKLTTREEIKKIVAFPSKETTDMSADKLSCSAPTLPDIRLLPETKSDLNSIKPDINPLIPNLQLLKSGLNLIAPKENHPNVFHNVGEIIRTENIKSFSEEHKNSQNGNPLFIPTQFPFTPPKFSNVLTPPNVIQPKIHVKNINDLQDSNYDSQSDEESAIDQNEPMALDLSKKKSDREEDKKEETSKSEESEDLPQDLTKKAAPIERQDNVSGVFAPPLLKTPPKVDPLALYQLANMYRNGFPGFPNWPGFSLTPLLFPPLQSSVITPDQDRLKMQLGGGTMIADNFVERFKTFQQLAMRNPGIAAFNGMKVDEQKQELKPECNFSPIKPNSNGQPPLTLNVDSTFDSVNKLRSPIGPPKPDIIQSPNSVKMVIKNGVLMPKQKQRRYRTERPFTCEHCSARFTLRSNMERHIKQQHPQYWSQRPRNSIGTPGRKSQGITVKPSYCDLSIPNYEMPKTPTYDEAKDQINEKLKFAILAQHLRNTQPPVSQEIKREEDEESNLVIDENDEKTDNKTDDHMRNSLDLDDDDDDIVGENWKDFEAKQPKVEIKSEENQDLVPISRLLDNASQQQFKEFFKRDREEQEACGASEEDEEGLVASGSTSEGNISGTDENRSENEAPPVKKKSAYSLAPNRVTCPYCSRKFPWTSSLRRHILTHTGQKPFKCSHCPLLFTTKSNCDRHLLRKHGNTASTISTEVCSSANANYLMRNVPERPFKCSSCSSSTFSTYSNLKKHISCKHATNAQGDDIKAQGYEAGSSEDEKIMSTSCKSDWENQISLPKVPTNAESQAAQIQNSDLPFKCHLCEGSFADRQDALDHIKDKHVSEYELLMAKNALDPNATTPDESNHHEDDETEIRGKFPDYSNRKVVCAFCMRRFWSAEDLRRHMRTHTGERPFSCDICRRRFTLKHSMLRHRKKHGTNPDNDNINSDEDANNTPTGGFEKCGKGERNNPVCKNGDKTDESDGTGESDLISNLLGIGDRSFIEKVLTASADDAAKLLGVKNGAKE